MGESEFFGLSESDDDQGFGGKPSSFIRSYSLLETILEEEPEEVLMALQASPALRARSKHQQRRRSTTDLDWLNGEQEKPIGAAYSMTCLSSSSSMDADSEISGGSWAGVWGADSDGEESVIHVPTARPGNVAYEFDRI